MKTVRLLVVSMVFAALFAVSSFAQTTSEKVGLINTAAFGNPKGGITKYIAQVNKLNAEFKPDQVKLQNMAQQLQAKRKEINDLQKQMSGKNPPPIGEKTIQAKVDQYKKLERDIKFLQEDVKARLASREKALLGPIPVSYTHLTLPTTPYV